MTSENIYFESPYRFTDPIRLFKANDPVYYEVQNIPLKELQENVKWVKDQVEGVLGSVAASVSSLQGQVGSQLGAFEIDRSKFSELRPYVGGTDNIVKVKAGRFTGRVNDAYDITPLQLISQTSGFNPAEGNTWDVSTMAVSSVRALVEKFIASDYFANMNGLAERMFTYESGTDTAFDTSLVNRVRNPNNVGWLWWGKLSQLVQQLSNILPRVSSASQGPFADLKYLENAFIKKWRGVTRTAVVSVDSEIQLEVPKFDANDFFYYDTNNVKQLLPATQRIDLLFVYTKPIDASSTTVRSFGADSETPKKIYAPQLGIVKGAGVGVSLYRPNNGTTGQTNIVERGVDNPKALMLSHHGDENGTNIGIGSIKGSFPSPDDLMNIAPLLADNLASSDFRLIGQSILPLAYIVVRADAELNSAGNPILTSSDIIDIRPFFRTAELTYNERAGIAAATPQISIANPVATESYVDFVASKLQDDYNSKIGTTSNQILDTTKLITAGYILGGYDYGVEGGVGRLLNLLENNNSRDETFMKARVKAYLNYQKDVPQYPEWDVGEWVARNTSYSEKGTFPLDRVNILANGPSFNGISTKRTKSNAGSLSDTTQYYVLKKTIQFDAASQGIYNSNDYVVVVDLHNCKPLTEKHSVFVERKENSFTIYIAFPYNTYPGTVTAPDRQTAQAWYEVVDSLMFSNFNTNIHNQSNLPGGIKRVFCTYPTVSFKVFSLPKTNVGLTTSYSNQNPLITI